MKVTCPGCGQVESFDIRPGAVFTELRCALCGYLGPVSINHPEPELELSFDTEPIIGWRVWTIRLYERRGGIIEHHLHALNSGGGHWRPGQRMEAECRHGIHDAPWPSCQCGLWAVRDRETAEQQQTWGATPSVSGWTCVGKVAMWGRVLEFERGYRAQYAYPQELIFYVDDGTVAKEVGRLYGIPVKTIESAAPGSDAETARSSFSFSFTNNYAVPVAAASSAAADMAKQIAEMSERLMALGGEVGKKPNRPPRHKPTFKDAIRSSRRFAR